MSSTNFKYILVELQEGADPDELAAKIMSSPLMQLGIKNAAPVAYDGFGRFVADPTNHPTIGEVDDNH